MWHVAKFHGDQSREMKILRCRDGERKKTSGIKHTSKGLRRSYITLRPANMDFFFFLGGGPYFGRTRVRKGSAHRCIEGVGKFPGCQ